MSTMTKSARQLGIEALLAEQRLERSLFLLGRANRYVGQVSSIGAQQLANEITDHLANRPKPAFVSVSIANPGALSADELRAALTRANDDLMGYALRVDELTVLNQHLGGVLANLFEMQLQGRFADLNDELERLAGHYQQQKAAQAAAGRVH